MRTEIVDHMVEGYTQMLHQRNLGTWLVVERHRLVQYSEISCLLYICHGSENEPHRIVIETAADVVVAALGQRLVLVVAAAVRELGGGYVYDTLASAFRNLMHKAHKVLIGVPEAHSAADSALEERGRTGHVEGDHALVLVPDVDHPVHRDYDIPNLAKLSPQRLRTELVCTANVPNVAIPLL